MKNKTEEKQAKTPDNKDYNPNNPQNITKPKFNSTTEHRKSDELPQIEDLNQKNQEDSGLNGTKTGPDSISSPKNDNSLHGKNTKTDLGNGKPDADEKEKEKIIRT